jgi:hypothetical protein
MSDAIIRPAFSSWPDYNRVLRVRVAAMTPEQLAIVPAGSDRWPLWASIGHLACQRVFWLCDFAGEAGADTTPFTNAGFDCPGDDDLVNVLGPDELAEALDATFRIVERCLDTWTLAGLQDEIHRFDRVHTRGFVIQRVFSHDVSHISELNDALAANGLEQVDIWA